MGYLLDTNLVIGLMKAKEQGIVNAVKRHRVDEMMISSLVMHELYFGAYQSSQRDESLRAIERLAFPLLPFDSEDGCEAGRIRAYLRGLGKPIGPYDVLLAGQALRRGLIVVTANLREFERVPGLRCEDWSR